VVRFKPTVKYEVCPPKQAIKDTSAHRRRQARCTGATWSDAVVIFSSARRMPSERQRSKNHPPAAVAPVLARTISRGKNEPSLVVRRRGDFSGRGFGLPKYRAPGVCSPRQGSGECDTPDPVTMIRGPSRRHPRSREDDFARDPQRACSPPPGATPLGLQSQVRSSGSPPSLGLAVKTHRLYHEAYLPLPPCPLWRYLSPMLTHIVCSLCGHGWGD